MKTFLRLNVISFLYSIILVCWIIPHLNIYRIERLTALTFDQMMQLLIIFEVVTTLVFTVICVRLIKRWFLNRVIIWTTIVLWIPYLALMVTMHNIIIPITNKGDALSAGGGFAMLAGLVFYMIYIVLLIAFVMLWPKKSERMWTN